MEIKPSEIRSWSRMGTRATFGMGILKLVEEEPDFFVLSADLGASSGLERFRTKFPDNFINVGIAEQNLIGVAAGLAKDGTPVFATSFAPFISMRAGEQIRMNMGYMSLNVKAVGIGSGLAMTNLGSSHYGIEDIAIMRAIPNITILSPADCTETVKCIQAAKEFVGPVYIRLTGGVGNPIVYDEDYDYQIGKANILKDGTDIALIATGTMVHESLEAADILLEKGLDVTVVDMHTIKPLDTDLVKSLLDYKMIVTVEEHTVIGGLGSAVAEFLAPFEKKPKQIMIGIQDYFPHAGDYVYLLNQCGLTARQIVTRIEESF